MPEKNVCQQLLNAGSCQDDSCAFAHDVKICVPCGVVCHSAYVFESHLRGRKHRSTTRYAHRPLYCNVCSRTIDAYQWAAHISGKSHASKSQAAGISPQEVEPEDTDVDMAAGFMRCAICSCTVQQSGWSTHQRGTRHKRMQAFMAYRTAFEEAERDKHGVTVSGVESGLNFGVVEPADAEKGSVQQCFKIRLTVPSANIRIREVKLSSKSNTSPFQITNKGPRVLRFGADLDISVTVLSRHVGRYYDRIEILFEDVQLAREFIIVRPVHLTIGNRADHELLQPRTPYVPRKRAARGREGKVVPGIAPPAMRAVPYVVDLPHAHIPERISNALAVRDSKIGDVLKHFQQSLLPASFNASTHALYFKTLLWAEEFRMDQDLQVYDVPDATLNNHGQFYYLGVPGLAEKRPSVLVGDSILVQPREAAEGKWFEGRVHFVRKEEVGLCFNAAFRNHYGPGKLFNVRFKLNRHPLRRQHQALDAAFCPDRVLFPNQGHIAHSGLGSTTHIRPFIYNQLIANNEAQLQAVATITSQSPGAVPFIVFGPPGTGKTVTVVEAILQVLRKYPQARIFACAPSNSAADIIALRLRAVLGTNKLFRFYAPSRIKETVPLELLAYTRVNRDGHFTVPPMAELKEFRVIVSTCVSASFAHGIGMPRGHFSHLFFDEAGQASEPEVLIAIKTMADNATNVVLSGDPKQLGPVIRSPITRKFGLEKSFVERLMELEVYDEARGSSPVVVKLVKNFRSHSDILTFPNTMFYRGDLQPCGDSRMINAYLGCSLLPNKDFPIVFHAVSGKDDREGSSPSFFNADEASLVKQTVTALRGDHRFRTTDADIGVIAPYHAQVVKIRSILRPVADGVKVGSVEEFQGQERPVIIISTVRSSQDFIEYDLKHTLGFVANPRRFNVAVTRAKALLYIVGDPKVLSLDPMWRKFLNYIHQRGGWLGEAPSWDTTATVDSTTDFAEEIRELGITDMNEFARRMETLTKNGLGENEGEEDNDEDVNVDRPWREME